MIMLIHSIAENYGCLPSEVIARATTFDMVILDTALTYRNMVQERHAKSSRAGPDAQSYSVDDLLKIKERFNAENKKG